MRVSPIHDKLAAARAAFRQRWGVDLSSHFAERPAEYAAVREAVGLTDFSFARTFSFPEQQGIDFLDGWLAGNVPKIRFGRVLHTFLADPDDGLLVGDCYVANNDQEFILVCESILPDAELDGLMQAAGAAEAQLKDLSSSHVLLSLDGFKAWAVVKKLFGPDVLGLPYLSIENYSFQGEPVRLIRAGKTSEFGYLLLAPSGVAGALFDTLRREVEQCGGRLCGADIHDDLRLEGRFFNIHREGQRVRDPLVLGLQWMIDFEKEKFSGSDPIKRRRAAGLDRKIIGLAAEPGCEAFQDGAHIYHQDRSVAEVVTSCFSYVSNQRIGLAVFPAALAYAGLTFQLGAPEGPPVRSISMPPIMPKSLSVKLDEL